MTLNRLPKVVLLVCWAAGFILLNSLPTEAEKERASHQVDTRPCRRRAKKVHCWREGVHPQRQQEDDHDLDY